MPLSSPLTEMGERVPMPVAPPGEAVTSYETIGSPPLESGGRKLTVARPLPPMARTLSGMPGGDATGITLLDAADGGPSPAALKAVTVNVYESPLVRPKTTTGESGPFPSKDWGGPLRTMYPMIDPKPVSEGAVKLTLAWPAPATAL